MGDIAVDIFLETLKQFLTSSSLDITIGTKDKVKLQCLEKEIKDLRKFLKITEKKRNEYSEVMKLVMQIRDVVFEAENIVERFIALVSNANHAFDSRRKNLLNLGSVEKKIKTLMDEVNHIYDLNGVAVRKLEHTSTKSGEGSSSLGGRNTSKVVEGDVVVGFEDEVNTLMAKLHDSGELGELEIISIIGIGGGGKTTLAREVYNHSYTLEKFDIRAWVNVSQDYNETRKRDLLFSILKEASPRNQDQDYVSETYHMLGEKVYKCLRDRKYLIVMDDIWSLEAWYDIQRSFPREGKGSKLLLTSRLPIQPNGIPCVHHSLDLLPISYSWELLQKKVFKNEQCPPELVDFGKQIARKCEGLPLAIVVIAGILATEDKTVDVWQKITERLSSTIAKNKEGCMDILELSYNHLPLHLKACFLYIGGHPEDYEIYIRELIWKWIGEGFIQQSEAEKCLEAIAEDYLKGLVDRNLVMVARKSKSHGGIKRCRIHDLLRELCLKKAEEDNFLHPIFSDCPFPSSSINNLRRLFTGHQFFHEFPSRPRPQNLRSFVCFKGNRREFVSWYVKNFKLLRVLTLLFCVIPGRIRKGDLAHLRYLDIYSDLNNKDHRYLDYFPNLESFQVSIFPSEISLPRNIYTGKMVKLRHLYTKYGIFSFHDVSDDEDRGNMLDSLQTLCQMCTCEHCLHFLARTPNLRKLGLFVRREVLQLLDLQLLKCLEEVKIAGISMRGLYYGLKLPSTLTRLTLQGTFLKWEDLSTILQTLPSLAVLKIRSRACVGPVWDTSELEKGFSQLNYLELTFLEIEEWKVEDDQFPRLEVLVIRRCISLERIPIEFANSYELREIKLECCSESLEESAIEIQEKQRYTKGDDCLKLHTGLSLIGVEGPSMRIINIKTSVGEQFSNQETDTLDRRPSVNYMEILQREITPGMRGILVNWLVEVCQEYRLVPDTLYLTIHIVDLFLSQNQIERRRLQLLGVASILIASKYEDFYAPSVKQLCEITDNAYTREELVKMETQVLIFLSFNLSFPTTIKFLRRFIQAAQTSFTVPCVELEFLANYLAELSLVEYSFLKFPPSLTAASAVFLAKWTLNQSEHPWNPTLEHHTSYVTSDLKDSVVTLQELQLNSNGCSLNAVREKYRQQEFKCVANLSSPRAVESVF